MADIKHNVVRLDNVQATHDGSLIKSGLYTEGGVAKEVDNGSFVEIGGLVSGQREEHEVTAAKATSTYFGIVATPEVNYDQTGVGDTDLANFTNEAGTPVRVIVLTKGDTFAVTEVDGTPAKNKFVVLQAGTKGKVADSAGSNTAVGKIIDVEKSGRYTYTVIEVQ